MAIDAYRWYRTLENRGGLYCYSFWYTDSSDHSILLCPPILLHPKYYRSEFGYRSGRKVLETDHTV